MDIPCHNAMSSIFHSGILSFFLVQTTTEVHFAIWALSAVDTWGGVLGVPEFGGFRKEDRKRDRQSITASTDGF